MGYSYSNLQLGEFVAMEKQEITCLCLASMLQK